MVEPKFFRDPVHVQLRFEDVGPFEAATEKRCLNDQLGGASNNRLHSISAAPVYPSKRTRQSGIPQARSIRDSRTVWV